MRIVTGTDSDPSNIVDPLPIPDSRDASSPVVGPTLEHSRLKDSAKATGPALISYSYLWDSAEVAGDVEMRHSGVRDSAKVIGGKIKVEHSSLRDKAALTGNVTASHCNLWDRGFITGTATVTGTSLKDKSFIMDSAQVNGCSLADGAQIRGSAHVIHTALKDKAIIEGQAVVEHSQVRGMSLVTGNSTMSHGYLKNSVLCHGANVKGSRLERQWICGISGSMQGGGQSGKFSGHDDPMVAEHLGGQVGYGQDVPPPTPYYSPTDRKGPFPDEKSDKPLPLRSAPSQSQPPVPVNAVANSDVPAPTYDKEPPPSYDNAMNEGISLGSGSRPRADQKSSWASMFRKL